MFLFSPLPWFAVIQRMKWGRDETSTFPGPFKMHDKGPPYLEVWDFLSKASLGVPHTTPTRRAVLGLLEARNGNMDVCQMHTAVYFWLPVGWHGICNLMHGCETHAIRGFSNERSTHKRTWRWMQIFSLDKHPLGTDYFWPFRTVPMLPFARIAPEGKADQATTLFFAFWSLGSVDHLPGHAQHSVAQLNSRCQPPKLPNWQLSWMLTDIIKHEIHSQMVLF